VGMSLLTHKTPMAAEEIRSRTGMSTTLLFDIPEPLEENKR